MNYEGEILIPYNLTQDELVLDPHVARKSSDVRDSLDFLVRSEVHPQELERIMRAATLLYAANAGAFELCIETAIIWERG